MELTAQQLLTLVTESSWGMPVRDMEALISLGSKAVPSLVGFLEQGIKANGGIPWEELLWPTVVLGEIRDQRAVPVLMALIHKAQGFEVPVAAAEALGKIGSAALGATMDVLGQDPEPRVRILLYAALAQMGAKEAWEYLEDCLETDTELDFVVARALAERNDPQDREKIYAIYAQSEPWKRASFEETLVGLFTGRPPWSVPFKDWRLRYRRQPRQALRVHRSWPDVLLMLWENRHLLRPESSLQPLPFEELLYMASLRRQERICPDCGQIFRAPTGIPLCSEVEEDLIGYQIQKVREWIAHKWEDIHEVLDELDHHEMEALQLPEESDDDRAYKGEALDAIEVMKITLCWMVEQGATGLRDGERMLRRALRRARKAKTSGQGSLDGSVTLP